ncbi:AmpG family muropeptide MFS transporter [Pasteurella multocida]|uniref:AmpG family muropeptide MFS transporter n=1 Tax=Pasteurella multocida TaxID=747 RepID=UPI002021441C|nr:AmpG family muropeptide MFS transporter [Pasteurella multocida]MCL7799978.1 AmpG family muropeptide MFS transporter [Pasteurella multocida]MCL7805984.1 AmpG family muropeptide MFS transporter [Pasteurella multocida]MCL7807125.1 AmpG family muropeptide MFS transporter [Pasteurella multocida]MCL7809122.1 AmpG family muropeptide MFS transporter [Pasteurella multocida]MCL7814749.1 AmpG family muropeptide MFS transporter [Pasteurella multocida]
METQKPSLLSQIFSRNMLLCIFTGFSSGLPLYVLFQMVPAWLSSSNVDVKTIGFFTLIGFPYTWKFIISPLLDRYYPNFLGRRRSWMFMTQVALLALLALLGQYDPVANITIVAVISTSIAVFSAVQDIVIDAYRREILTDEELGLGNSIHVNAYRISGLIPGGLSLILADSLPWDVVFIFTALFMIPGLILSLFLSKEPDVPQIDRSLPFYHTFALPFKEFFSRKGVASALGLIFFIFLYKFGDSLATSLQTKFILDMGFSKTDIGTVVKLNSLWASIISGMLGGILMLRIGINRSLWLFGFVQLITILGFVWMASYGKFNTIGSFEFFVLTTVIIGEYIGVGLGTAAFVAFMARETNPLYTATQLAIFTSLSAIPSKIFSAFSGVLVADYGYYTFFWICFFSAIPGMLMLFKVAPWHSAEQRA